MPDDVEGLRHFRRLAGEPFLSLAARNTLRHLCGPTPVPVGGVDCIFFVPLLFSLQLRHLLQPLAGRANKDDPISPHNPMNSLKLLVLHFPAPNVWL